MNVSLPKGETRMFVDRRSTTRVKKKPCRSCTKCLAIITCHYNPCRFTNRINTYWRWRTCLGELASQVTTVELSFSGVSHTDADILLHGDETNLMWQKEALLNIALDALPDRYKYVAWVDHDIIFRSKNWVQDTVDQLQSGYDIVQLYSQMQMLDADDKVVSTHPSRMHNVITSQSLTGKHGGAWAANRDWIEKHRFPDRNIIGCGDVPVVDAAIGQGLRDPYWSKIPEALVRYHEQWLPVGAEGTFIQGTVAHLYHGTIANRQYGTRTQFLSDYHPYRDVRKRADGVLEFTGANPELQTRIHNYFQSRSEDT